jgi:hypothetical protein
MKYKDNNFLNYQDKQRSGEFDYNSNKSSSIRVDRQIRREQEHRLSLFYRKKLWNKIEKVWWDNLKTSDKEEIRRYYSNQLDYLSHDIEIREYLWYSYKVFDIWEEWFDYIKVEFKPNKVTYRQDKLKILGI